MKYDQTQFVSFSEVSCWRVGRSEYRPHPPPPPPPPPPMKGCKLWITGHWLTVTCRLGPSPFQLPHCTDKRIVKLFEISVPYKLGVVLMLYLQVGQRTEVEMPWLNLEAHPRRWTVYSSYQASLSPKLRFMFPFPSITGFLCRYPPPPAPPPPPPPHTHTHTTPDAFTHPSKQAQCSPVSLNRRVRSACARVRVTIV